MYRRGLLRLLGVSAAGLALATIPEVEEITRRFWPGYRAAEASRDATQIIAGRDVLIYTAPWNGSNHLMIESPWGQPWTDSGITRDGLRFSMRLAPMDVRVDEAIDPISRVRRPFLRVPAGPPSAECEVTSAASRADRQRPQRQLQRQLRIRCALGS